MSKKEQSSVKTKGTDAQPELNWLQRQLNRKEIELPELFVSLHEVIRKIAECNSPWTYQSAAKTLKRHLTNDDAAPAWRRFTDRGERGELEPNYGKEYGRPLLENAAQWGEPVVWDASHDYGHDHFKTLTLPLYEFMMYGPNLGFEKAAIIAFLERHGVKAFGNCDHVSEAVDEPNLNVASAIGSVAVIAEISMLAVSTASDFAKAGAHARHAPTRDAKALALKWWAEHRETMNKEEAADAITAARLVEQSRSTVRKWLRGA